MLLFVSWAKLNFDVLALMKEKKYV